MRSKSRKPRRLIQPEELVGEEWAEWYRLTPAQRWVETEKLWQQYLAMGGSLDPEPDTQSPFFDAREKDRAYWLRLRAELERMARTPKTGNTPRLTSAGPSHNFCCCFD